MKTKITFLLMTAFLLAGNLAQSQVVIQNDSTFKTADQMLLANELFESGEPFAEALGYNLDDLDPMVLNSPDSISYTTGIENYEYSRYLLGTVISRSGIGLHMMWSPMVTQMAAMEPEGFDGTFTGGMVNGFNEDDELMKMIGHFSMLANQMAPANPFPQFAEFETGNMHLPQTVAPDFQMDFSSLRWDRDKMDKTLNLAAMGQTMLKQYWWAKDMLGAFHDAEDNGIEADGTNSPDSVGSPNFDPENGIYYGGNNLDGFIGQVLTAESVNKTLFTINSLAYDGTSLGMVDPMTYDPANGIQYFPHRIAVTETMVNEMLPPQMDELTVTDASSHLWDQLSFLWATLSFKNMMDPEINDPEHYAYHEVFDGDPFPAPMSVTGMPGPFDLMMGTSKVIFMNTLAMHFNATEGTFVDVSNLDGSGQPVPENTISAENAGYSLVVLAKFIEEFAATPLEPMAANALNAQTDFIIANLKKSQGGFYNSYTLGNGGSSDPQSLSAQAAIIRGLYASYVSTGNTAILQGANDAYNYLINTFYVPSKMAFRTEVFSITATYDPYTLAVLSGALREASLVGNQSDAATIYTRVFKNIYNGMILSEAEQSGETGNDSDGDGIPYIAGGTLPFVFAARGILDINVLGINPVISENSEIRIYPNPATKYATIEFNLIESAVVGIKLFDLSGRLIHTEPASNLASGPHSIKVALNSFTPGTYILRLDANNDVQSINKLIVSK
ncbi:MAG: T9SS type A sorting domain-containing protein [Bacteroidales bacterium]|nr:T9SS type A sorting domain-containing protein [Bacteroidales bacterium]